MKMLQIIHPPELFRLSTDYGAEHHGVESSSHQIFTVML